MDRLAWGKVVDVYGLQLSLRRFSQLVNFEPFANYLSWGFCPSFPISFVSIISASYRVFSYNTVSNFLAPCNSDIQSSYFISCLYKLTRVKIIPSSKEVFWAVAVFNFFICLSLV